ncbi:hypothetical protein CN596_11115 [Bacillus toyonensis]|uniref:Uncharacterized protein n=1 Tax=Bacillus toyonensis TaxID=155322 RepID=A0AB36SNW8_9BACI|nr:hypothetical protein [Bacillus toyonensis]MCU4969228.1 hypothetical protein [Bacillus toyonensis]PEJ86641.1 hypothetical protein CN891_15975 [Bacillus toyonensis]PEN55124.1 hypothetical protein CN596_11115 [Bacillus toyonensis]PGE73443.1 hypothetical protein COM58_21305 [Bacillus toyonensis]
MATVLRKYVISTGTVATFSAKNNTTGEILSITLEGVETIWIEQEVSLIILILSLNISILA